MNNNKGKNSKDKNKAKTTLATMIHSTTRPGIKSPQPSINSSINLKGQTNIGLKQSILYKKKDRDNSFSRDSSKNNIFLCSNNTSLEVTKSSMNAKTAGPV